MTNEVSGILDWVGVPCSFPVVLGSCSSSCECEIFKNYTVTSTTMVCFSFFFLCTRLGQVLLLFEVCPPCHPSTILEIPSRDSDTVSNKRGSQSFFFSHSRAGHGSGEGAVNPPAARLQSRRKANHPLKFFSLWTKSNWVLVLGP